MSDQNRYELVVSFDTDDPTFARGVEVGMLWQRLQVEELPLAALVHASNAEMAWRLAEARGTSVRSDDPGVAQSDWIPLVFG